MIKLLSKLILQIIANGLGLLIAAKLVSGVVFHWNWLILLEISLVLALINILIRPILKFIFGPLIFLTLGIFSIVINAAILWAVVRVFPAYLEIPFGWSLLWSTLIIAGVNFMFNLAKNSDD